MFDAEHNPVGVQTFATNVPSPVSLEHGPGRDDLLPVVHDRSDPPHPAQRPVGGGLGDADVRATRRCTVSFSSAGSTNPGGGSLTYLWDFGDGTTSTQANPTHTYTSRGVQDVHRHAHGHRQLRRVVDRHGRRSRWAAHHRHRRSRQPADGTPVEPGQTVDVPGLGDRSRGRSAAGQRAELDRPAAPQHPRAHVRRRHRRVGQLRRREPRRRSARSATRSSSPPPTAAACRRPRSVNLPVVGRHRRRRRRRRALTATAGGAGQINLAWPASTDDNARRRLPGRALPGRQLHQLRRRSAAPTGTALQRHRPARRRRPTATACGPSTRSATSAATRTWPTRHDQPTPPPPPGLVARVLVRCEGRVRRWRMCPATGTPARSPAATWSDGQVRRRR